ncbi:MAG TPA: peroxiredoxin [Candidatus Angelobacter sp.]|nr:peroxiredoxin [Candidatus Angelobacter sp.]
MTFTKIAIMVMVGSVVAVLVVGSLAESLPAVGSVAPDFTLKSQDGNSISLSQFRGKWVVLYFYPRDMTKGCTLEAHNFQRDQEKFQAANAVVLGVSVDDTKSHQEFCTKEGLTFKLLSDNDHKVSEEYGSLTNLGVVKFAKRHTFLIDPQGKIVKEYADVDSDINQHSEQVLAALAQLQK